MKLIYLIIGGSAGTVARYLMSGVIHDWTGPAFPYGTLAVNTIGCFLIGFLSVFAGGQFVSHPNLKLIFAIGFCGAFTTFSAFILESSVLLKDGNVWHALGYIFMSLIVGFLAFGAGVLTGKAF